MPPKNQSVSEVTKPVTITAARKCFQSMRASVVRWPRRFFPRKRHKWQARAGPNGRSGRFLTFDLELAASRLQYTRKLLLVNVSPEATSTSGGISAVDRSRQVKFARREQTPVAMDRGLLREDAGQRVKGRDY